MKIPLENCLPNGKKSERNKKAGKISSSSLNKNKKRKLFLILEKCKKIFLADTMVASWYRNVVQETRKLETIFWGKKLRGVEIRGENFLTIFHFTIFKISQQKKQAEN